MSGTRVRTLIIWLPKPLKPPIAASLIKHRRFIRNSHRKRAAEKAVPPFRCRFDPATGFLAA